MDLLKIPFEHPIKIVWKIKRADFEALKDSNEKIIFSQKYFASKIAGIAYRFGICPNGFDDETKHEIWIGLKLKFKNVKEIKANFEMYIESANFFKMNEHVFKNDEKEDVYEIILCKSDDFFDPVKNYFVNDELIIKIDGTLKFNRPLISTIPYSISTKWTIKESEMEPLRASINGSIESKEFNIPSNPDIKYYLVIYSNGDDDEDRGKVTAYLPLIFGNEIIILTSANFKINSHEIVFGEVYEETKGYGMALCSTEDLFDATKGYFINGEITIELNGYIFVEKKDPEFLLYFDAIETGTPETTKYDERNFVVVIDEQEIHVNKDLLADVSTVCSRMMQSGMKETIENKTEITDFPFKTVDSAIKLLHGISPTFTLEDMLPLLVFADKYDIQIIKDLVEDHLIKELSPSNVCQLIHFSNLFNAPKLYKKSVEFFRQCSHDKTAVYDLDLFDKEMYYNIFYETFPAIP